MVAGGHWLLTLVELEPPGETVTFRVLFTFSFLFLVCSEPGLEGFGA